VAAFQEDEHQPHFVHNYNLRQGIFTCYSLKVSLLCAEHARPLPRGLGGYVSVGFGPLVKAQWSFDVTYMELQ